MSGAIRFYRPDDAAALATIFHAAVHALAARDYTPEQLAAWSPEPGDPASWAARATDGRITLVAVDGDDEPVAYADLERDGHIDHLYRHPDYPGSAAQLYPAVEDVARSQGLARLHTEASETARRFFSNRGFTTERRREFTIGGTPIHNWAMTKTLTSA